MAAPILRTHVPADLADIVAAHRRLYSDEYGFDADFADYVTKTLEGPIDRIWIADMDGRFAGCIGVVRAAPDVAQLRWFLVDKSARGTGLGKRLIDALIEYCRKSGYKSIFLWTVSGLPAARYLYQERGFTLTETKPETLLWGKTLAEERWDLTLK